MLVFPQEILEFGLSPDIVKKKVVIIFPSEEAKICEFVQSTVYNNSLKY